MLSPHQIHHLSGSSSSWARRRMLNTRPTSCSLSWMRSAWRMAKMPSGRRQPGQNLLWEQLETALGNKASGSPAAVLLEKGTCTGGRCSRLSESFLAHFAPGDKLKLGESHRALSSHSCWIAASQENFALMSDIYVLETNPANTKPTFNSWECVRLENKFSSCCWHSACLGLLLSNFRVLNLMKRMQFPHPPLHLHLHNYTWQWI